MGPSATQMLGDLGADVVKVESPGGDVVRGIGPQGPQKMGPLFLAMNRNKRRDSTAGGCCVKPVSPMPESTR